MQGQSDVISMLNEVLTAELTSVHQYMVAARTYAHWGYERLYEKTEEETLDELGHARSLTSRILLLGGAPDAQTMMPVHIGKTVTEQLAFDLENESSHAERLNAGIALSRGKGDNGSADLLESILKATEEHVDYLEAQLEQVKQVGEANYLSQQIRKG